MFLENACFERHAMAGLWMVRDGLFGELVHCRAGYEHDLRERLVTGKDSGIELAAGGDYRSRQNRRRNADLYPTHDAGPIAEYLDINRGNRFLTIRSTASKSSGLNQWSEEHLDADHPAQDVDWARGDIVTSTIETANGETVILTHDTSLPRPHSRGGFRVQGTEGLWMHDGSSVYVDGWSPAHEWEPFEEYREEFEHPLWERFLDVGVRGGHGGADFLMLRTFVQSLERDLSPPIDVYDAATWMAISPLSGASIANGGEPTSFPDFTNGAWMDNEPIFGFADDEPGSLTPSDLL
jgi:hypothetical protein